MSDVIDPSPVELVVLLLATLRISLLIVEDTISAPLRHKFWERWDPVYPTRNPMKVLAYITTCMYCTSFWVALGVVVTWAWVPDIFYPIYLVFALAGGISLLERYVGQR